MTNVLAVSMRACAWSINWSVLSSFRSTAGGSIFIGLGTKTIAFHIADDRYHFLGFGEDIITTNFIRPDVNLEWLDTVNFYGEFTFPRILDQQQTVFWTGYWLFYMILYINVIWLACAITSECPGSKTVVGFSLLVSTCNVDCDCIVDDFGSLLFFSIDDDCAHNWDFVSDSVSSLCSGELVLLSLNGAW